MEWAAIRGGPNKDLLSMAMATKNETTFSYPKQGKKLILHLKACLEVDDGVSSAVSSVAEAPIAPGVERDGV